MKDPRCWLAVFATLVTLVAAHPIASEQAERNQELPRAGDSSVAPSNEKQDRLQKAGTEASGSQLSQEQVQELLGIRRKLKTDPFAGTIFQSGEPAVQAAHGSRLPGGDADSRAQSPEELFLEAVARQAELPRTNGAPTAAETSPATRQETAVHSNDSGAAQKAAALLRAAHLLDLAAYQLERQDLFDEAIEIREHADLLRTDARRRRVMPRF